MSAALSPLLLAALALSPAACRPRAAVGPAGPAAAHPGAATGEKPDAGARTDTSPGKWDPRAHTDGIFEAERAESDAEVARLSDEVKGRIAAILAPVDAALPLAGREKLRGACLQSPPDRAAAAKADEEFIPTELVRKWWAADHIEMLCGRRLDLCAGPMLHTAAHTGLSLDMASDYCPILGLHLSLSALREGRQDRKACLVGLAETPALIADGMTTYEGLDKFPGDKAQRICGLLAQALGGDVSACRGELSAYFQEEGAEKDDPGSAYTDCVSMLAFTRGLEACGEVNVPVDRVRCLSLAATASALKAKDSKHCGGDPHCRALFGDPALCAAPALAKSRAEAVEGLCGHIAALGAREETRRLSVLVNKAYEDLNALASAHEGFFRRKGSGRGAAGYLPAHLAAIGNARGRLDAITASVKLPGDRPQ